ncbi:sugar ABC transporter ATP-binding protein, partial [Thermococci archaeon]
VALARALVREPEVFLLDEPLSNLDAKIRTQMRFELKKLLSYDLGITTIYVTHDQVEAMTMADRIAVMNKGVLQQVGTPNEIFYKPANTFVGTFVGSPPMNLIEGEIIVKDNKTLFNAGEFLLELPIEMEAREKVILGFRPQHVEVNKDAKEGFVKGKLLGIEKLGVESYGHIPYGNLEVVVQLPESMGTSVKEVHWKPRADRIYIFDAKTRELIYG